jgi:ribosomal protein L11 methyltransferase
VRVGVFTFIPAPGPAAGDAIRLIDSPAFGTGLHPTTALCLEAIAELTAAGRPARMLDIGTGSGILALAALHLGVPQVTGVDVDAGALEVAGENAALNGVADRLTLLRGGPDVVEGLWPLVVANIRAGELMALAPALTRRVASGGTLVLSGIPQSAAGEVEQSYRRLGMTTAVVTERDGWVALALGPSW